LGWGPRGLKAMSLYGERKDKDRPILQISMPRLPRLYRMGRGKA